MKHLLIDADSALYKAGLSNETRKYTVMTEEGTTVAEFRYKKDMLAFLAEPDREELIWAKSREVGPVHYSIGNLKRICNQMITPPFAEDEEITYQMYIQGSGNFREEIYEDYKGNRNSADKPVHMEEMVDYLKNVWGAIVVEGEETDDKVSYLQYQSYMSSTYPSTCIVTIDKDLKNTPGYNYNYDKKELIFITPEEADLNFARQLLTGDSTDNIPGLKGMGPKTAVKILPEWREDWLDIVIHHYKAKIGAKWEDWLNLNGRLLHMRREPNEVWDIDYDYK